MALTKEDLQAIQQLLQHINEKLDNHTTQIAAMMGQQQVHTRAITKLENSVMHELKLLNENLPGAIARNEDLRRLEDTAEAHDTRIYALEQQAANS